MIEQGQQTPNRVAEYRRELGLTLRDVAAAAGLSPAGVFRVETGSRRGRPATRRAIAAALGVPYRIVFPGDPRP